MKILTFILFFVSIVNGMPIQNKFSEKINQSKDTEKNIFSLQERINLELVNNIAIKTNLLKKTDENYMRLNTEKSLTGVFMKNFLEEDK